MNEFLKTVLDIIYPEVCAFCGRMIRNNDCIFCDSNKDLYLGGGYRMKERPQNLPSCDIIYCAGRYYGAYKEAVVQYKFNGELWIGKQLSQIVHKMLSEYNAYNDCDYIVYVPISKKRMAQRGFDQSLFIAGRLSEMSGIPTARALFKNENGGTQSKLNRKERFEKSKDRFACDCRHVNIAEKNILLLDDIITTGATMEECARLLKSNGCRSIKACAAAGGRRDF